jgi:hypothetical protein
VSASYGEMMRRLYADPGVSPDDLPQISEGVLSLAAFDRLVDEIGSAPLSIDPYCGCPACRAERCEP